MQGLDEHRDEIGDLFGAGARKLRLGLVARVTERWLRRSRALLHRRLQVDLRHIDVLRDVEHQIVQVIEGDLGSLVEARLGADLHAPVPADLPRGPAKVVPDLLDQPFQHFVHRPLRQVERDERFRVQPRVLPIRPSRLEPDRRDRFQMREHVFETRLDHTHRHGRGDRDPCAGAIGDRRNSTGRLGRNRLRECRRRRDHQHRHRTAETHESTPIAHEHHVRLLS